jgi:hypothetical protein
MEKRDFRVPLFGGAPCMAKNNKEKTLTENHR